jgi:hypothetical protein
VSALRERLRVDGEQTPIAPRPGGYVLTVEPEQIDARRFERLVADGRARRSADDAVGAAATLREALGLWRGEPLCDLRRAAPAEDEIRRLTDLHRQALSERIDTDLAVGRAGSQIGEIEARIAEDPLGVRPSRGPATPPVAPAPLHPAPQACPFRGLSPWRSTDAEAFAGREDVISDLLARAATDRLVALIGPAGVGKSSILHAGLLPALAAEILPGSERWRQVLVEPGPSPVTALERAVGGPLVDALVALPKGERLVIVIDQLGEVARGAADEAERARFLDLLAVAACDPARRALVLVALRPDQCGRLVDHSAFARHLRAAHAFVGPMSRGGLRRAIQMPAQRAGLVVEPALTVTLVQDAGREPTGLALLSSVLVQLWRERPAGPLTLAAYRASGGALGAVGRLAEAALDGLSAEQKPLACRILGRLVAETGDDPRRRRILRSELERLDGAAAVLEALIEGRLLRAENGVVELAHEAMARDWPRLAARLQERHVPPAEPERPVVDEREDAPASQARDRIAVAQEVARAPEAPAPSASAPQAPPRERRVKRRKRALLGFAVFLVALLVAAGAVAMVAEHRARPPSRAAKRAHPTRAAKASAALAGHVRAEAVGEPRLDLAMLVTREGQANAVASRPQRGP